MKNLQSIPIISAALLFSAPSFAQGSFNDISAIQKSFNEKAAKEREAEILFTKQTDEAYKKTLPEFKKIVASIHAELQAAKIPLSDDTKIEWLIGKPRYYFSDDKTLKIFSDPTENTATAHINGPSFGQFRWRISFEHGYIESKKVCKISETAESVNPGVTINQQSTRYNAFLDCDKPNFQKIKEESIRIIRLVLIEVAKANAGSASAGLGTKTVADVPPRPVIKASNESSGTRQIAAPASISHCSSTEQVIFTCSTDKKIISICKAGPLTQYRFGPKDAPEIALPQSAAQADTVTLGSRMYSGGGAAYMRFRSAAMSYVVYTGSGKGWSKNGVAVQKNDKTIANVACKTAADTTLESGIPGIKEDTTDFELP